MFEQMTRGGVTTIYMQKQTINIFLISMKMKHIFFLLQLDVNNLYGWSMKQKLPIHDFKFVPVGNTETWVENVIEPYTTESDIGYILEVDLEYPETLHDLHNDYPLALAHLKLEK